MAQEATAGRRRAVATAGAAGGDEDQAFALALVDASWSPSQYPYLQELWQRESGWSPSADNPASGAYGIPQALPAAKMATVGADWATDPYTQILWGISYIQARYGSPQAAWTHETQLGWYQADLPAHPSLPASGTWRSLGSPDVTHRQIPVHPRRRPLVRRLSVLAAGSALAMVAAACGSSAKTSSSTTTAPAAAGTTSTTAARGSGPVDVLYAGSLVSLMNKQVGPGFQTATGYTFSGFSGDSGSLATDIKGKVRQGDVFISASPTVNAELEGAANGNWVSWYATFASSSLVLGYNPSSKFAADLKTKPWYQVLTEPGIQVGRTDPTTDPKGKLTVQALTTAATADNAPGLSAISTDTGDVYPENTLVGRLQSGQLDAGFFYAAEAKAAGIPTVPLTGINLKATYTITVLNQAPDEAGAEAFVKYLLGSGAASALSADGFDAVSPPTVSGSGVPASLNGVLPTS